jgi:glutaredoxin
MSETTKSDPKWTTQATEKVLAALNRADELGGEIRDYLQDRVATDPRYVQARKRIAKLLGKSYESKQEGVAKAQKVEAKKAAVAAPTPAPKADAAITGFGNPGIKAQVFGKTSDAWTGRAITILEKHKVDFDYVDLEQPEHEAKLVPLTNETKQHTVPFVYLRGQFVGGYNALAEIERLGQLEFALMTADERAKVPAHARFEIVSRPNTDDIVPAEHIRPDE